MSGAGEVKRKDSFPDNFFDITALKTQYPMGGLDNVDAAPLAEDASDVQQTIEGFKKLYQ